MFEDPDLFVPDMVLSMKHPNCNYSRPGHHSISIQESATDGRILIRSSVGSGAHEYSHGLTVRSVLSWLPLVILFFTTTLIIVQRIFHCAMESMHLTVTLRVAPTHSSHPQRLSIAMTSPNQKSPNLSMSNMVALCFAGIPCWKEWERRRAFTL